MCNCGGLASGQLRYDREAKHLICLIICDSCNESLRTHTGQAYVPDPKINGHLAQSVEQGSEKPCVTGSIPVVTIRTLVGKMTRVLQSLGWLITG